MFSGGVSEFIYGYEKRNLGDFGAQLGKKVRARANQLGGGNIPLRPADVRIRATVIGASQYTVQVSGNTIYLSHPELLPLRNLQVVTPQFEQNEAITRDGDQRRGRTGVATLRRRRYRSSGGIGDSLGAWSRLSVDSHSWPRAWSAR